MGSYQNSKNHSNQQVPSSTSSSSSLSSENKQRTYSTTQNCLFKILRTITTIPSDNDTIKFQSLSTSQLKDSENGVEKTGFSIDLNGDKDSENGVKRTGFSIDLNVGFCVESNTNGFSCGVVEKCSNNECEVMKEEKLLENGESLELSKFDNDGVSKNRKAEKLEEEENGFMGLLIEAARLIFGEFKDDDEDLDFEPEMEKKSTVEFHNSGNRTKQLKRKNKNWGVEYVKENVERKCELPVIRSKRGRIQVLPCKYRDSVVEPLTRFSRNRSRIVSNNRRQGSLRGNVG